PLPREPTTPTPPPLPPPGMTRSGTRALWHLPQHAPPPSPLARRQRVAEYVQRRNSALQRLRMNPEEFTRRTQTLLASLGQKHPDGAPKDWAHRLLDLNDQGIAGQLSEDVREDLRQNAFKRNELRFLVDEVHTSPNPGTFTSPVDPTWLFHVQQGAPFDPKDARLPEQRNQAELNAASAILRALNPNGGLFEQPAACTIGLSAHQRANSVPSAFRTWGQTIREKITAGPQHDDDVRSDGTLCYHHSTAKDPPMSTYGEPEAITPRLHPNSAPSTPDLRGHPWDPCRRHPPRDPRGNPQDHPGPPCLFATKECPNPHRDRRDPQGDPQHPPRTPIIREALPFPPDGILDYPLEAQDPRVAAPSAADPLVGDHREAGAWHWAPSRLHKAEIITTTTITPDHRSVTQGPRMMNATPLPKKENWTYRSRNPSPAATLADGEPTSPSV
ncbi:hypothetical protein C0992_009329, partial [Termitomyces sp. T32_za158]